MRLVKAERGDGIKGWLWETCKDDYFIPRECVEAIRRSERRRAARIARTWAGWKPNDEIEKMILGAKGRKK